MTTRALSLLLALPLLLAACDSSAPAPRQSSRQPTEHVGGFRVRNPGRGSKAPKNLAAVAIPELHTEALDAELPPLEPGRDPFRYGPLPAPNPPPSSGPSEEELAAMRAAKDAARANREAQEAEPVRPQPPPFTLEYLGSFGPRHRRIAVFQNAEEVIVNAIEGEVLQGKFRVAKIGYESVTIEFVGFPDADPQLLQPGS